MNSMVESNIKEYIKKLFKIWLLKIEFTLNEWRDNDKYNIFNANDLHNEYEYHHTSMATIFYNRISCGLMCIYAIIYKIILQYLFILFMVYFCKKILQMLTQILHLGRRSISNTFYHMQRIQYNVLFACAYNDQTKILKNVNILYYIRLMIDYNVFNLFVYRFCFYVFYMFIMLNLLTFVMCFCVLNWFGNVRTCTLFFIDI